MSKIEEEEKKVSDFECPVCYDIMIEPRKLHCGHRFCSVCLRNTKWNNSQCPMCRAEISKATKIDKAFQNQIKEQIPQKYHNLEAILQKKGLLFGEMFEVEIEIGNHYLQLKEG
jgi:hypothetical protein